MQKERQEAQAAERELAKSSRNDKNELVRRRVVSLRLNDYAVQAGRNRDVQTLAEAIKSFVKAYEEPIKDRVGEKSFNEVIKQDSKAFHAALRKIMNFYRASQTNKQLIYVRARGEIKKHADHPADVYWEVVEAFLNAVEEKYCYNYRYYFYKDVYTPGKIGLREGVYKLERPSTLNKGYISVSKLTIRKSIDITGKNVFNEPGRERWGFLEEKVATREDVTYRVVNHGRIVCRNNINLVFLGRAVHGGGEKGSEDEKDLHFMILRQRTHNEDMTRAEENQGSEGILTGLTLETIHDGLFRPFATKIRAIYMSGLQDELSDLEFVQRPIEKPGDDFFMFSMEDPYILTPF